MWKTKFIKQLSNDIIKEKFQEWLSVEAIIAYFRLQIPQNDIELRVVKRSVCILWWFLLLQNGKFKNKRLIDLLSYLQNI